MLNLDRVSQKTGITFRYGFAVFYDKFTERIKTLEKESYSADEFFAMAEYFIKEEREALDAAMQAKTETPFTVVAWARNIVLSTLPHITNVAYTVEAFENAQTIKELVQQIDLLIEAHPESLQLQNLRRRISEENQFFSMSSFIVNPILQAGESWRRNARAIGLWSIVAVAAVGGPVGVYHYHHANVAQKSLIESLVKYTASVDKPFLKHFLALSDRTLEDYREFFRTVGHLLNRTAAKDIGPMLSQAEIDALLKRMRQGDKLEKPDTNPVRTIAALIATGGPSTAGIRALANADTPLKEFGQDLLTAIGSENMKALERVGKLAGQTGYGNLSAPEFFKALKEENGWADMVKNPLANKVLLKIVARVAYRDGLVRQAGLSGPILNMAVDTLLRETGFRDDMTDIIVTDGVFNLDFGEILFEKIVSDKVKNPDFRRRFGVRLTQEAGPTQLAGKSDRLGGIDLNSANLDLQIKRDGKGVPLPLAQQDMAQLSQIAGFVPRIIEIKPAASLPMFQSGPAKP